MFTALFLVPACFFGFYAVDAARTAIKGPRYHRSCWCLAAVFLFAAAVNVTWAVWVNSGDHLGF